MKINTFYPSKPHEGQKQVLDYLDSGGRYVQLRAGRKWRKTSLIISWLFERAMMTGLVAPYIAPSRVQAKNIAWNDHVIRILRGFKEAGFPYKTNESELSVSLANGGKVQLHGVENKEGLRGISNWCAVGCDEYDDWEEDIWPTIIRPNLLTHASPAVIGGTPKGFRNLYRLENDPNFKCFHFTSHDNPELDRGELNKLEEEYQSMGMGYYRQEILAEYEKPVGVVYEEWPLTNFVPIEYDARLPLYITFDFGVNDPTAIIWIQKLGGEYRIVDYYESSDANVDHFVQVINAKPYKVPELCTGDPAGKARSITTNTSPIEEYNKKGIHIRTKDGVQLKDQIRITHKYIKSLFVSNTLSRFRECMLNYRYPEKSEAMVNQSNEIPVHDQYSHAMRALEYFFVNIDNISPQQDIKMPEYKPYDPIIGV